MRSDMGLGTGGETYVLLDRNGALGDGGGLNAGPRDLARFAIMLLNDGVFAGRRVVGTGVIDRLAAGASRDAFLAGPEAVGAFGDGDRSYRAPWWVRHTRGREAFTAIGIHGQWIYVDRGRGVAVVKQSSRPVSADNACDEFVIDGIDAIIDHLAPCALAMNVDRVGVLVRLSRPVPRHGVRWMWTGPADVMVFRGGKLP